MLKLNEKNKDFDFKRLKSLFNKKWSFCKFK